MPFDIFQQYDAALQEAAFQAELAILSALLWPKMTSMHSDGVAEWYSDLTTVKCGLTQAFQEGILSPGPVLLRFLKNMEGSSAGTSSESAPPAIWLIRPPDHGWLSDEVAAQIGNSLAAEGVFPAWDVQSQGHLRLLRDTLIKALAGGDLRSHETGFQSWVELVALTRGSKTDLERLAKTLVDFCKNRYTNPTLSEDLQAEWLAFAGLLEGYRRKCEVAAEEHELSDLLDRILAPKSP